MPVTSEPTPVRRDPGVTLWAVTAAAWVATVVLMLVPAGMAAMPAMAAAGLAAGTPDTWLLVVFAGGWVVMVVAMMLPTTIPMTRVFVVTTANAPSRGAVRTVFFAAYVLLWLVAGLVGLVLAALVGRATAGVAGGWVLAGALALAGAFQFSPLKRRCLTLCRDPRAFLFSRYRRGVGAAWSLGLRHAVSCLGCCWALMAVMFAVGSAGLVWMLGLTAVMAAEKTAPWGRRVVAPLGAALLVAALVVAGLALLGTPAAPVSVHHHM